MIGHIQTGGNNVNQGVPEIKMTGEAAYRPSDPDLEVLLTSFVESLLFSVASH